MKPERIVLHHSATQDGLTVSWNAIRRYHVGECCWEDIGYHFGIELVGDPGHPAGSYEIMMGRMPDRPGAHTSGHNSDSLGVCFVGNFDHCLPPDRQWKAGLNLVAWLCRLYRLQPDDVHGHREFANKSCPGEMFDINKFRRDLIPLGFPGCRTAAS